MSAEAVGLLFIGCGLGMIVTLVTLRLPRHRHEWEVVSAWHGDVKGWPCTLVGERCSCGAVRQRREEGHWTIADLTPDSD